MVPNAVAMVTCEVEIADWLKHSALYFTFGFSVNGAIMKQHLCDISVESSLSGESDTLFDLPSVWMDSKTKTALGDSEVVQQHLTGVVVINLGGNNNSKYKR